MTAGGGGGGPAEKVRPGPKGLDVPDVVAKMMRYLERAELNRKLPVSLLGVLRHPTVNLARSTIDPYLKDPATAPLFAPVREKIEEIQKARASERATVAAGVAAAGVAKPARRAASAADAGPAAQAVDEIRLAALHEQARAQAVSILRRFEGRTRRCTHVSDLPVTARELGLALHQLQHVMASLRPLAEAWINRPESRAGGATEAGPQRQLGLGEGGEGAGVPA